MWNQSSSVLAHLEARILEAGIFPLRVRADRGNKSFDEFPFSFEHFVRFRNFTQQLSHTFKIIDSVLCREISLKHCKVTLDTIQELPSTSINSQTLS